MSGAGGTRTRVVRILDIRSANCAILLSEKLASMLLMCGGMMNLLSLVSAFASLASIESPIVGGTTVREGDFSDVVLVVGSHSVCTGTLVAPDVVLTAGHCIGDTPKQVLVGSVDYSKPGGELIAVTSAVAYPNWEQRYDVGVLVLEREARYKPRAIAKGCRITATAKVLAVGFGLTSASGTGTNSRLHQAELAVDDPTCGRDPACAAAIAPNGEFTAGGHGTDSCFGDSGGPLYLGEALIGVVSRGVGTSTAPCGGGGVYVRANKVVGWIERTTGRKLTRSGCLKPKATGQTSEDTDGETPEVPGGSISGPSDEAPSAMSDGGLTAAGADPGGCSAAPGVGGLVGVVIAAGLLLLRRRGTTHRTCPRFR